MHIGTVRTALYNFLFTRHVKGTLILRIEDTDQTRSSREYEQEIVENMKWLGLSWDETYRQSERLDLYKKYAERLVEKGKAYEREDPGKGKCLVFKIHRDYIEWDDLIHARIGRDISKDPDIVITKSDGWPTYNFACVVDDIDMKVTHIIRGDDHVANTPKQISLYRALGEEPPRFAHIPLILNPDGSKMSKDYKKRDKGGVEISIPTAISDYRKQGYLPETMVNFLALLGWSPGEDRELMTLREMVELFTIERVNNTPAQFDVEKLTWMNGHYIRAKTLDELVSLVEPYLAATYDLSGADMDKVKKVVHQNQERIKKLEDIVPRTAFFFQKEVQFEQRCVDKYLKKEHSRDVIGAVVAKFKTLDAFTKAGIESTLRSIADEKTLSFKDVSQPVRVAVTGTDVSPPIDETLETLGKEETVRRLEQALKIIL
jgi:glutamyl-tRNA synthetase